MGLTDSFVQATHTTHVYEACRTAVEKHFGARRQNGAIALDMLAKMKGIKVEYRERLNFEGMIERSEDGSAAIVIRRGLNRRRERFTFAHELGHWILQEEMLGTTRGKLFRGVSRDIAELREEERLANLLAAELLLPADEVEREFDTTCPLHSLVHICRKFAVSRTMAVRRIADICGLNIVFLQIMPYDLQNTESAAQIDDAVYASSRSGTLFDRERTRFRSTHRFADIIAHDIATLDLATPKGQISAKFCTQFRRDPVLHAFALVTLDAWPATRGSVA